MLIDTPFIAKSQVLRKSVAYTSQVPRAIRRLISTDSDFRNGSPLIVGSIPKSGTHLLLQAVRAVPNTRYYGSFLQWATSRALVARNQRQMNFQISKIAPSEVVPAHIHYTPESAARIKAINAINFLAIRDPRDIAISEAEYVTFMNPWHRVHRYFRNVSDGEERVRMIAAGIPEAGGIFPDFGQRLRPFLGWLDDPNTYVVRFEDMRGPSRNSIIWGIAALITERRGLPKDGIDSLAEKMGRAIDPKRSHTFRAGRSGHWRTELSDANRRLVESVAGDVIVRLGYAL